MERIIISAIVLYALFLALYLLRERMLKRKKGAAKTSAFNPFRTLAKEDIIGKSKFDLRQSRTEATTLTSNEKRIENAAIFAAESKKEAPVTPPLSESETPLSDENKTDENSNDINLVIENTPPNLSRNMTMTMWMKRRQKMRMPRGSPGFRLRLDLASTIWRIWCER